MIVVGELINASRKTVAKAIEEKDEAFIKKLAIDQYEAGANYIDVNAGIFVDKEGDYVQWLIEKVKEVVDIPCCIDSPDAKVIEKGLMTHGDKAMVNSISLEKERFDNILHLIAGTDLRVIALCMDDTKMPETKDERMIIADKLINSLVKNNVKLENIFIDPLVQPIATDASYGIEFLESVSNIMSDYKGIHTICGLSNISYGLPERKFINRQFATMAVAKGLDSLIVDPLDKKMMTNILVSETLAGKDKFCMKFLKNYRGNKLEF